MSAEGLPAPQQRNVIVQLTESLVPLVMPVQEACYPSHLHEASDSFVDKVVASPTTSFVCLQVSPNAIGGQQDVAFPLVCADGDEDEASSCSPGQTSNKGSQKDSNEKSARAPMDVEVVLDVDPDEALAAATGPSAIGYLITIPAERFQAPALDSNACPKPDVAAADTLLLHDMAVLPEARGRGVAQTLLSLAEQKREELQLERLALIAVGGADRFWAKQGFEAVHDGDLPADMKEKLIAYGEEAVYMEKVDIPDDGASQ